MHTLAKSGTTTTDNIQQKKAFQNTQHSTSIWKHFLLLKYKFFFCFTFIFVILQVQVHVHVH